MKRKNKLIFFSFLLVIVLCSIFFIIKNKSEKNMKKVNLLSGDIEQTKEYKLYEFGIEDNDISKAMKEIVNEVVNEYSGDIDYEYVDVTKNISLSNIYNIEAIPTFIIVDLQGNVKYRKTGKMTKNELIEFVNKINK